MAKIVIDIKSCKECPHFQSEIVRTSDSFERPEKWTCKKSNKVISNWVDWYDKVEIPKWCPVKLDNKKS